MELIQAKEIIIQALDIAIKKGCYGLSEVEAIVHALTKINGLDDVEFGEITEIKK